MRKPGTFRKNTLYQQTDQPSDWGRLTQYASKNNNGHKNYKYNDNDSNKDDDNKHYKYNDKDRDKDEDKKNYKYNDRYKDKGIANDTSR